MEIRTGLSLIASGLVAGAVWINALWLQEGRHPAPLFVVASAPDDPASSPVPPALPATASAARLPAGPQPESAVANEPAAPPAISPDALLTGARLAMLQRALFDMGFYDGPVDGIDGPRTHFAILSYQKAHGLSANAVADEGLLAHARRANGEGLAAARPGPLTADQRRLRAVQLVLLKLGYIHGAATGTMNDETHAAIARFQREHGLPVTGEMSGPLMRELSAVSGVSIEESAG